MTLRIYAAFGVSQTPKYILNERSAAYDDKCKYPCSYRKDFEQLKNDK